MDTDIDKETTLLSGKLIKEALSPLVYGGHLLQHKLGDNFLGVFGNALTPTTCKSLIELFERKRSEGFTGPGRIANTVDPGQKHSQDWQMLGMPLTDPDAYLVEVLLATLTACFSQYQDRYSSLKLYANMGWSSLQLQKYSADQNMGYPAPHVEASGPEVSHRVLAGLIYLNTINTGGTVFPYQDTKVPPTAGSIVLFPAGYTHLHWGEYALQDKYIITTWLEFME